MARYGGSRVILVVLIPEKIRSMMQSLVNQRLDRRKVQVQSVSDAKSMSGAMADAKSKPQRRSSWGGIRCKVAEMMDLAEKRIDIDGYIIRVNII